MNCPEIGGSGCRLTVVGVGGGGINAVNRMIAAGLEGVEFAAFDRDQQMVHRAKAGVRLRIGRLGRGFPEQPNQELGRVAAEESREDISLALGKPDLVFIVAGLGGSTGTGASQVVAEVARQAGALTIGVFTLPLPFEKRRLGEAEKGIEKLYRLVDSLIIVSGESLLQMVGQRRATMPEVYRLADDILRLAVQAITDLITVPFPFAPQEFVELKHLVKGDGNTALVGMLGLGRASGRNRAVEAARQAVSSPLLEAPLEEAKNVMINITARPDLAPDECKEILRFIMAVTDPGATVVFGGNIDPHMEEEVRVTLIATGFDPKREIPFPARRGYGAFNAKVPHSTP